MESASVGRGYQRYPTYTPQPAGPLIIYGKRWYFRLVTGTEGDYSRARALMDDYTLNQIAQHTVICFTPDRVPGRDRRFRNKEGGPIRIYAFFESYVEFFRYMSEFQPEDRSFYEIVFGELPQKPHFDIDIDLDVFERSYPHESVDTGAEQLKDALIQACGHVLNLQSAPFNIAKDLLLYSSHGPAKRSFHVVLNNMCHDGNREARAFYDAVVAQIRVITGDKYAEFVDRGVYSSRQQFRMVGSQKLESGRPKVFHPQFQYGGQIYTHIYTEEVSDPAMQNLVIIYESMVSFISGCSFIPSLIPPRPYGASSLSELPDLDQTIVSQCLAMLQEKMNPCPFVVIGIKGHVISLRRLRASLCPLCNRRHEHENPRMYLAGGKIYWDCRRTDDHTKKFLVGYLALTMDTLQHWTDEAVPSEVGTSYSDDETESFMFGEYNLGPPTLAPPSPASTASPSTPPTPLRVSSPLPLSTSAVEVPPLPGSSMAPVGSSSTLVPVSRVPPVEHRQQHVTELIRDIVSQKEKVVYQKRVPGPAALPRVSDSYVIHPQPKKRPPGSAVMRTIQGPWKAGLN